MVVRDLHIVNVALRPAEADPVLIIDPDTVPTFPLALQYFQAVTRRRPQVIQASGGIEVHELPECEVRDLVPLPNWALLKDCLGIGIAECPDHASMLLRFT